VLGGVHVDGDQDAALDLADLEDPPEVAHDSDTDVEPLAGDLVGSGGIHERHLAPPPKLLVKRPGDDVRRGSPEPLLFGRQLGIEESGAVAQKDAHGLRWR
jgi:hypothetical protein